VAEMMGMATSGGYYIASAADRIVAHPTTVTGSIGVMLLTLNVEGLENLVGVQVGAITSGTHKDILSPFRPMTDEEREIIQNIINSLYDRFLDVVEEGRGEAGLTRERLRPLADGRIFTAQQALDAGLIDEISYLPDLVDSLKRDLGLRDVKVVSYRRGASGDYDIYSRGGAQPRVDVSLIDPKVLSRDLRPGFYYLWQPGL
jgi:protease-4